MEQDKRPSPRSVVKARGIRSRAARRWRYIVAPWNAAFWRGGYARNVWTWSPDGCATFTLTPGPGVSRMARCHTDGERFALLCELMPGAMAELMRAGYGSAVLECHNPVARSQPYRVRQPGTVAERRNLARWFSGVARFLMRTAPDGSRVDTNDSRRMAGYGFLIRHNVTGDCPLFADCHWHLSIPVRVSLPHIVQRYSHRWEPLEK